MKLSITLLAALTLTPLLAAQAQAQPQTPTNATPASSSTASTLSTPSTPDAAVMLQAAATLYAEGAYAESAAAYQSLADEGLGSAALYHNLGHAWLRQGEIGRAILSYERAARIAPRDPQVRSSLDFARRQAAESPGPGSVEGLDGTAGAAGSGNPPLSWRELFASWLTRAELVGLVLALWWLCAICLILARHRRPGRGRRALRLTAGIAAVGMVAGAFGWAAWTYDTQARPRAIVVLRDVEAAGGPGPTTEFAVIEALPPGSAVRLLETRSDYTRVALPIGGREGWVPVAAVERVER
jgi:tetratricopeptide (TPR) repeat protein